MQRCLKVPRKITAPEIAWSMIDVENPEPLVTPLMSIAGILQRLKSSVSDEPEFDEVS